MIDLKKQLEDFYNRHQKQILYVDHILDQKKDDIRLLYTLITKRCAKRKNQIVIMSKYAHSLSGEALEDYNNCIIIISIYEKYGLQENDWFIHWEYYFKLQHVRHWNYSKMNKLPRQDNKTNINYGNRDSSSCKIRYPRKKRKTAWKRFYKLFPYLKKEEKKL